MKKKVYTTIHHLALKFKSRYPIHADAADQTILVVRNVRRTLTEFHHIMWDLKFVTNYAEALLSEDRLYTTIPPPEHFLEWRDDRVMGEIHWYGKYK